eukprot:COSAG04_NODE_5301_length_1666_cov_7.906190_2_plen_206_part_00
MSTWRLREAAGRGDVLEVQHQIQAGADVDDGGEVRSSAFTNSLLFSCSVSRSASVAFDLLTLPARTVAADGAPPRLRARPRRGGARAHRGRRPRQRLHQAGRHPAPPGCDGHRARPQCLCGADEGRRELPRQDLARLDAAPLRDVLRQRGGRAAAYPRRCRPDRGEPSRRRCEGYERPLRAAHRRLAGPSTRHPRLQSLRPLRKT